MKRIAIVGGASYSEAPLLSFLYDLSKKYPSATIVTGSGRGAEGEVARTCKQLGMTVEIPPIHRKWFGSEAMMCQINDIISGADVIVVVGNGGRPKQAIDIWHRMNMHRRTTHGGLEKDKAGHFVSRLNPWNVRELHQIAAPAAADSKAATSQAPEAGGLLAA